MFLDQKQSQLFRKYLKVEGVDPMCKTLSHTKQWMERMRCCAGRFGGKPGVPECRSPGMPECRSSGVLESRSAGVTVDLDPPVQIH